MPINEDLLAIRERIAVLDRRVLGAIKVLQAATVTDLEIAQDAPASSPVPPARMKIRVTPATIRDAARSASPGTHILTDGDDYSGLTIEIPNGTATDPVVILPLDPRKPATFRGCRVGSRSRHAQFFGQIFDDRNYAKSDDSRCMENDGQHIGFHYCDWWSRGIGIAMEASQDGHTHFSRCSFLGQQRGTSGNGGEAMKLGGRRDYKRPAHTLVEWCRFRGYRRPQEDEGISIKSSRVTIRDCDLDDCANIWIRHGTKCTIQRVRMPGMDLVCFGTDHILEHIICRELELNPGTRDGDQTHRGSSDVFASTKRCTVRQIRGKVKINRPPWRGQFKFPAIGHWYADVDQLDDAGSKARRAASIPYQEPPKLADGDVGTALYRKIA